MPLGPQNTEASKFRENERLTGLRESPRSRLGIHKRFGELSFLVNAVLGYGKLDWPTLEKTVRERIADAIVRMSHSLGIPVGAYMTDLLEDKIEIQLIDNQIQGTPFPEQLKIIQLVQEAHKRGNRLMVLEIDPHSNKADLAKTFLKIFSESYAVGVGWTTPYASKMATLGVPLPTKLAASRSKLTWQRLQNLTILDGSDELKYGKLRTMCDIFLEFPLPSAG